MVVLGREFVFDAQVVLVGVGRTEMGIDDVNRATVIDRQEASGGEIEVVVNRFRGEWIGIGPRYRR